MQRLAFKENFIETLSLKKPFKYKTFVLCTRDSILIYFYGALKSTVSNVRVRRGDKNWIRENGQNKVKKEKPREREREREGGEREISQLNHKISTESNRSKCQNQFLRFGIILSVDHKRKNNQTV